MIVLKYWVSVFTRAWRDTPSSLRWTKGLLFRTSITFIIAITLLPRYEGADQIIDEVRWGIVIVQALLVTFVLTYFVNLVSAPPRMSREKKQQAQIDRDSASQEKIRLEQRLNKIEVETEASLVVAQSFVEAFPPRSKPDEKIVGYI